MLAPFSFRSTISRLLLTSGLGHMIVKRYASIYALNQVRPVTRRTDQLANSQKMYAGILLRIGVLDQGKFAIRCYTRNLGHVDKVGDALAISFEVETRVLECIGCIDDGLPYILCLVLCRDLANA